MTKFRLLSSLGLFAVILAACASGTPTVPLAQPVEPSSTVPPAATVAEPAESLEPTVVPIATSRGPDLEATDPSTVSLASGDIQLVEFFRFT
jgi:hypothetical protein